LALLKVLNSLTAHEGQKREEEKEEEEEGQPV
jgi:hypothetical protein